MKKLKFCFFGQIAGALNGKTVGGAQVQIALLAKALALKGHEVVIVDPFSDETFITPEGIHLINVPDWNKGVAGVRMFTNRIPALYKLFLAQKADYYYVRTRAYVHLACYLAAKKAGGKFIQAVASDIDVFSFVKKYKYEYKGSVSLFNYLTGNVPNDLVFKYLLKRSDYVLLQHSGQNINLASAKGKVVVFPNIIDKKKVPTVAEPTGEYFIQVGSLSMLKGTDNLYQLSSITDKTKKLMIVGRPNDKMSAKILEKLKGKENVIVKGQQSHTEALQLIANARALINTSRYEGFPNIFLEAWASGVPVISLNVNPGNVFNNKDLGVCCAGDINKMKVAIETGTAEKIDRTKLTSYVLKHHDFDTAADRFLEIIHSKSPNQKALVKCNSDTAYQSSD